jgi:acetolactate synthase regulatory subunit
MKRGEAVGLLKELIAEQLIHPSLVLIGERSLDNYQLQIKGNYDCKEIEQLVKDRFSLEENNGYLILYKP